MKFIEVEGETIDEAIANAVATLGMPRERVRVEILNDARRGLLGFGGQKARVRASAREEASAASTEPAGGVRVGSTEDAARVLRELLALMDVPAQVEATPADEAGQVVLHVTSEAGGLLIGRRGQTLDALEYLVNRIVGRQDERGGRIVVDAEGYRERRSREVREMAIRLAARVRQTARAQSLDPLSPRERRIVHLALSGDTSVSTRSVGEGQLRRVVISPAGDARGRRQAPDRG
ncbi:MAG TPA: RNA-binding cell elongation regulator Jag/EloR [Candidatus Binatia bacterium]|nr:RNA-binding cell elongation regulator Jag/EloR [Candidatus Binatia bacterium]